MRVQYNKNNKGKPVFVKVPRSLAELAAMFLNDEISTEQYLEASKYQSHEKRVK